MDRSSTRAAPWRRFTDPALAFIAVAVLWEYAVDLFGIKRYLLPPLSKVAESLWTNRATLLAQSWVTTQEILVGFIAAVVGGVMIGLATYAVPLVRRTLYPLIVVFQGLPKIALAPLMVIWFGYGDASKVLMAFLFAFFPVVIATMGGLEGTPAHLVEHFRAIRASAWTTFRRLYMPSALPSIMDGCKAAKLRCRLPSSARSWANSSVLNAGSAISSWKPTPAHEPTTCSPRWWPSRWWPGCFMRWWNSPPSESGGAVSERPRSSPSCRST